MAFGSLSVKGRALRYLAQREHSRAELERKLGRVVEDQPDASAQAQIAAALDELVAKDFLSETRTAESVLRSQGQRFGIRRIRQTLQARGLDPELISSMLVQARDTELERARDIWQRRYGQPANDAAARGRQIRFLAGRGFEAEVIRRVMLPTPDDE